MPSPSEADLVKKIQQLHTKSFDELWNLVVDVDPKLNFYMDFVLPYQVLVTRKETFSAIEQAKILLLEAGVEAWQLVHGLSVTEIKNMTKDEIKERMNNELLPTMRAFLAELTAS